jgi:hypothetical protein
LPRRKFYRRRRPRHPKKYRPRRESRQANVCSYCGRKFTGLAYRCNYCGTYNCLDHRLPEAHECKGLGLIKPVVEQPHVGVLIKGVRTRDGTIVDFDKEKITDTIFQTVRDRRTAEKLSDDVVRILEVRYAGKIPTLRDIYHVVNNVLIGYQKQQRQWIRHQPRTQYFGKGGGHRFRLHRRLPSFVWIPIMILLILIVVFFVSGGLFNYTAYILAAIVAIFLDWEIFQGVSKIDAGSDASLFGLELLAIFIIIGGYMLGAYWFGTYTPSAILQIGALFWPFWAPTLILSSPSPVPLSAKFITGSIFVMVFVFGLIIVGAFLEFRFMRGSGVIIYPR